MMHLLNYVDETLLGLLAVAMLLAFLRLIRGPHITDRVVALDLITTIGVAMSAIYATINDAPVYLDVAILVAIVTFVGTIAFAYYLERKYAGSDDS